MATQYINTKQGGTVETVDEFDTAKEAREMLAEYRMASPGMGYYLSSRCTKEWRER
jgi:hypothetical protein